MSSSACKWMMPIALGMGLAPGCESQPADRAPECDGVKCDELEDDTGRTLAGPDVVECWIDEGDSSDPFFQVDELSCRFVLSHEAPVALSGATVSVRAEDGSDFHGDELFRPGQTEPVVVASVRPDDYPLELHVQLTYDVVAPKNRLLRDLTRTNDRHIIASAADMGVDEPLVSRIPFDFWGVTLYSRDDVSALAFDHEIPAGGEHSHRVAVDARPLFYGQRARHWVPVAPESTSIAVTLGDGSATAAPFELTGPGDYAARDGVLAPATDADLPVRSEGTEVASCSAEEDGNDIVLRCSASGVAGAGMRTQMIVRTADGAEMAADLGDAEALVATLAPGMLPAELETQTVIEGKVIGLDPSLRESPHRASRVLAAAEDMSFHLGFEIWSVSITSEVDVFGGDLSDFVLELGDGYDAAFATRVEGLRLPSMSMGDTAELLFAAPVAMEEMPGTAFAVLGGDVAEDVAMALRPGSFRATMNGLVELD